jgi:hypothetical protein
MCAKKFQIGVPGLMAAKPTYINEHRDSKIPTNNKTYRIFFSVNVKKENIFLVVGQNSRCSMHKHTAIAIEQFNTVTTILNQKELYHYVLPNTHF